MTRKEKAKRFGINDKNNTCIRGFHNCKFYEIRDCNKYDFYTDYPWET